jgi:hypothetical protein
MVLGAQGHPEWNGPAGGSRNSWLKPQPWTTTMMLTEEEIAQTRASLHELQVEHRDLNLIVEHLAATPLPDQDQLLIQRLKKRKLLLKDKINQLERQLVPDIPA